MLALSMAVDLAVGRPAPAQVALDRSAKRTTNEENGDVRRDTEHDADRAAEAQ